MEKKSKKRLKITSNFRKPVPKFIPADQIKSMHLEPMINHKIIDGKFVNTEDYLHYYYDGKKVELK